MKEKFRYRSRRFKMTVTVLMLAYFVSLLLFFALVANLIYPEAAIAAWFLVTVGFIVVWCLLDNVPSGFKSDGNSVEFRLLFKKINIRYRDIISIEVTHEYAKPQIRGDVGGYREIIKFVCKSGEYRFENIMDIDLEQTAADPESLTEQFERGRFMRLKNYISKQTGITY